MRIKAEAKSRNHPEVHCCACGKLALQSALLAESASVGEASSGGSSSALGQNAGSFDLEPPTRLPTNVPAKKCWQFCRLPLDRSTCPLHLHRCFCKAAKAKGALDYLSRVHVSAVQSGGVPKQITLTPVKWLVSSGLSCASDENLNRPVSIPRSFAVPNSGDADMATFARICLQVQVCRHVSKRAVTSCSHVLGQNRVS